MGWKLMGKLQTKDIWSQLKKRKVVRIALAYLVLAWLSILFGVFFFEGFGFPPWVLSALMAVFLLGFPVVLLLAWAYEITPHGIRRDTTGDIEKFRVVANSWFEDPVKILELVKIEHTKSSAY